RDFVRAPFVADERAAILAGALAGPLKGYVHGLASRTRHVRDRGGVVELDKLPIDDRGFDRHRLARLDPVGRRVDLDHLRNAFHRATEAASVLAICVRACALPARVGTSFSLKS